MLVKEPQDIVGVFERERVDDQPADPEFRVPARRARVDGHRVQLEPGDLQRAEPRRALDLPGGPLEPVQATDQVVGGAVAEPAAGEVMLTRARLLLGQWDEAQSAVAEAAAAADMVLRVGFHTRIGRGLIPAVTTQLAQLLPGWKLTFRQVSWRDPTAGLASAEVDVAISWLPVPDTGLLSWQVVATEDRWVALPAGHRLAERAAVTMDDLSGEPFIALPAAAGPLRQFWLAAQERQAPPRIAAEAETAEETFEAVASGLGVALLAAGNAEIYQRDDVVCRPVAGLSPSRLAVLWRTGDHRKAIQVFTGIFCQCVQDHANR